MNSLKISLIIKILLDSEGKLETTHISIIDICVVSVVSPPLFRIFSMLCITILNIVRGYDVRDIHKFREDFMGRGYTQSELSALRIVFGAVVRLDEKNNRDSVSKAKLCTGFWGCVNKRCKMVYIDNKGYMVADTLEELHSFAKKLKLKLNHNFKQVKYPCYELPTEKIRKKAVALGAQTMCSQKLAFLVKQKKVEVKYGKYTQT